ncbi:MAG: NADH-quinone oxidoreductase subunit H [Candidatus Omnitrophota bacterium]|jgi:formate hydrogenlyase subunit 4
MKTALIFIQVAMLIVLSPLVSGIIRKIKNNIRMRKGAGIFQPYYNLAKLFAKEEVVSDTTSWIFRAAPFVVLASSVCALSLVPVFSPALSFSNMGDFLSLIFILALGRFFIALAGLDAGSAFGGMGSSREMFISTFVEPVALLSIFAVSLNAGSTNLASVSAPAVLRLSSIIAALSLFIVTIAETSRIPVDNRETHLELTMIHEAMVLEYSGRPLALIELASHIKQILFFSLIAAVVIPWGDFALKMAAIIIAVSLIEVSVAKMRLFRAVDFLSFAFVLSIMAVIVSAAGY